MQLAIKEEIGGIKMDTNQYMEMFLEESREHLQSLNDGLLALENDPEEVSVVNDIFRNAHTIKGMSATMGFTKIAELTHDMENVFDLLRTEKMKVNEDIMDTLFKTIDSLEQMIESVGSGGPEDVVDITGFASKLSALASGKTVDEAEPAPAPVEAAPAAAAPAAAPRRWRQAARFGRWVRIRADPFASQPRFAA